MSSIWKKIKSYHLNRKIIPGLRVPNAKELNFRHKTQNVQKKMNKFESIVKKKLYVKTPVTR